MENMKSSGVQWIGDIPSEWKLGKVKNKFYSTKTIVGDKVDDYERLALTLGGVVKRSKEANDGLQPEKFDGYQILKENELVFKLIDLANVATSRVGLSPYTGIVSPAYIVLHDRQNGCPRYAEYYFLSMWLHEVFNHLGGDGVRSSLSAKDLLNVPFLLISEAEQQAIADYLDDRCSKIDEIIAEATASIEEYKELKQAVIANAVLSGIDKNTAIRNTGENWCRTIPSHWRFERGKYLFSETNIRSVDGSEELLTVSQYTGITPRSMKNVTMFEATSLVDYKICDIGDIAANTMWMWAGAVGVSGYYGVISPSYNTYRQIKGDYDSKYLDYLLRAVPLVSEYESRSTGIRASRLRLYPSQFLSIRYPIPPMNEQKVIVEYLDRKVGDMDSLISEKQSLIEDLQAYKKSLIYEVVTGKRRVV